MSKSFTLESDASVKGLGAVLLQVQDDGHLHPVAYASHVLSPQEKWYAITKLGGSCRGMGCDSP